MTESPSPSDEQSPSGEQGPPGEQAPSGEQGPPGEQTGREQAQAGTSRQLTFRMTPLTLIAVGSLAICVTPVAWVKPWLLVIYLLPLALAVWVLRVRTVVSRDGLRARHVLSSTRFGWDELRSLRLHEKRWVRAVLTSGKEVQLPAVRVRDLHRLAEFSGGRLSDVPAPPEHKRG